MAQLTFYGTASSMGVGNNDGNASSCRNDANGDYTHSDIQCRSRGDQGGDNTYKISRGTAFFDSSSIPDNATISAAVLNLYVKTKNSGGDVYVNNNPTVGNQSTGLVTGDFSKCGSNNIATVPYASVSNGNWYQVSVLGYVSLSGISGFGFRHQHDYNNTIQPNGDYNIIFGGYSDGANKPQLIVTYTTPPAVTTGDASALQPISATLAGNVTDAGGGTVTRGVCWALTANPSISGNKATAAGSTGTYTVNATNLIPGTLYHYRAYVTTENSTQYGSDQTFTTLSQGGSFLLNFI